jgi:sterol desaturase/sphingolipid hydroxylase (fatty acid hydroxylase superfamily)
MPLYAMLLLILASSGGLMAFLHFAFLAQATNGYKIHPKRNDKVERSHLRRTVVKNSIASAAFIFIASYGLYGSLLTPEIPSTFDFIWEVGMTLALYDILYYLMHRFPFHEWKLLHRVHVVHHTIKNPTAVESLYMHPIENFAGLALLILCAWMLGPLSVLSYVAIVAIYSWLNILIHCGLDFRVQWLKPIAYMSRKHDRHHKSMRAGNYASISPIPDWIFKTLE